MKALKYILFASLSLVTACTTYTVTMVHSEGVATDLVDETQTQTPTTSITAQLPNQ